MSVEKKAYRSQHVRTRNMRMSNNDIKRNDIRNMRMSNDEEMMRGIMGHLMKRKHQMVEICPESLKLTKLTESDDIEVYLKTFERAVEACGVQKEKWSFILAPEFNGKAQQAYAALSNEDSKEYEKVKEAILLCCDINEETYRQRLHSRPKENDAPLELVTRLKDIAVRWTKNSNTTEKVVDNTIKEQLVEDLPEEIRVLIKEHKPDTGEKPSSMVEDYE